MIFKLENEKGDEWMEQTNTSKRILMVIDLIIFSGLAIGSEVINNNYIEKKGAIFYLSFSMTLCIIMMIRWGIVGVVIYLISGFAMMYTRVGFFNAEVIYYVVANIFFGIPILIYGKRKRQAIVDRPLIFLGFIFASYICACIGKGLALLILYGNTTGCLDYLWTTAFTLFINIIVCFMLTKRKELLCDMSNCFEKQGGENERKDSNANQKV